MSPVLRRAGALLALALFGVLALPGPARAQFEKPVVDRQLLLFLVDRVSFEELLAVGQIRALARAGGAALMSPRTVPGDRGGGAYLTLGTGVRSAAPEPRVLAFHSIELIDGVRADEAWERLHPGRDAPLGPFLLRPEAYVEANEGRAVPGLLGEVLAGRERTVAVFGNADHRDGRDRPGVLVIMDREGGATAGLLGHGVAPALGGGVPPSVPIADPRPDILGGYRLDPANLLFLALGARLPNPSPFLPRHVTVFDLGDTYRIDTDAPFATERSVARQRREALDRIGTVIGQLVLHAAAPDVMVIVVAPSPSRAMDRMGDELTPIVLARGHPRELFPERGPIRTLTSDTTRRIGVVSNEDVAPTVLRFFDIATPAEMNGSPIARVDAPAPFDLHGRHLVNRRTWMPVQLAAMAGLIAAALLSMLALAGRARIPRPLGLALPALPLLMVPVPAALLAAGDLSGPGYGRVGLLVAAVSLGSALAVLALRPLGPLVPAAVLGLGALAYLLVEAQSGWTATLTPLLGGSALDGARFYGLPNVHIGVLLGAGAFVAAVLPAAVGFIVLFFVGLFAGLPDLGANLGGALTMFVAAGLWLVLRVRRRFGWTEAGITVLVAAAGMALVLFAHASLADAPTHGSRFVRGSGGLLDLWRDAARRLGLSLEFLVRTPALFAPLVGLPAVLAVAVAGRGAVGEALDRHPAWRDALIVIAVGSVVALVANDSGASAASLGFGFAVAGILYLPLSEARWKTRNVRSA